MQISTYIEKSVDHELSGNIIDLCPVGALNNKAYRYRARAWEMTQHPLVSPHDCAGTNLYGHVLRGRLMRVVPRANEAINETWIADRDRYSCEGLYADDRAGRPMVKEGGTWREVDWETALEAAAAGLQKVVREHGAGQVGMLVSPAASLEEGYLAARVARGLGSENVDHRLRRVDFRDQAGDPLAPTLGCSIADLEQASALLLVGSNLRQDVPIIAHRVRKGVLRRGTRVAFVNPQPIDVLFPVEAQLTSNGYGMAQHLAAILAAAVRASAATVPAAVGPALEGIVPTAEHERVARMLIDGELRVILLGALAERHVAYSEIRALAAALAQGDGRAARVPARGCQCRRRVAGRRDAASRRGRPCSGEAGPGSRRNDRCPPARVRAGGWHRDRGPAAVVRRRERAAGRGLRRGADSVRRRRSPGPRDRDPAGRCVCGDVGYLGQRGRVSGRACPAPRARRARRGRPGRCCACSATCSACTASST